MLGGLNLNKVVQKLRHRMSASAAVVLFFAAAPLPYPIPTYSRLANPDTFQLKVSTLNIWALPLFGRYKTDRMPAVGQAIKMRNLDFAFIQEAWRSPYRDVVAANAGMPYQNYFGDRESLGSGLMSLTVHPYIRKSFEHFTLNTVLSHVWEGEAFCTKGVGLETIMIGGIPVSMFNTHTVARYTPDRSGSGDDEYTPERMMNVFEIFQHIVEQTDSDAFIVAGDFNSRAGTTEIQFWERLTSLEGIRAEEVNPDVCTFCGDNAFHTDNQGQLDYVWVSPRLEIKRYFRDFDQKFQAADGHAINLSDHYGWQATVGLRTGPQATTAENVKAGTTSAIGYLRDRLEHYLAFWKGIEKITPGKTNNDINKVCIVCRIKESIEKVKVYQDALDPNGPQTEEGARVKPRLESYFSLFNHGAVEQTRP